MILNEVFLPIRLKRPFERCRQAASIGTLPFFWHLVSYHRQRLAGTAHVLKSCRGAARLYLPREPNTP